MMQELSNKTLPEELSVFKNLGPTSPTTHIDIPEKAENRFPTDRSFLIAFGVSVVLLMPFLIHTLIYSDIRRLSEQIDNCGNICGVKNEKYDEWNCTGQDFTHKKYLKIEGDPTNDYYDLNLNFSQRRKCVDQCDIGKGTKDASGQCIPDTSEEISKELMHVGLYLLKGSVILRLILCSLIAVGASVLVLYIFRYAVGCVVWSMIVGVFILGFIIVVMMWRDAEMDASIGLSLICTILVLPGYVCLIYIFREKIAMVIVIFTEAAKAVFAMPSLIIIPITTFSIEAIILTIFYTTTIYMSTAGELVEIRPGRLEYVMTNMMSLAVFFNCVVTIWALLIVGGVQYMIVGGAVSEWYFAKDKTCLDQPVKKSASIAYTFHLGTVAFGALVIMLAKVVRALIQGLVKCGILRFCLNFSLFSIEMVLKSISKRAFIITAMHGQPFLKSGKRAASLILHNLGSLSAIRLIGRLTIAIGYVLVAFISVLISMILFMGEDNETNLIMVFLIIFFMSLFIGVTFFSLFEVTIDTIFVCFCEDSQLNDGMARPYAMSKELMDFVENSKKMYGVQKETANFDPQYSQAV